MSKAHVKGHMKEAEGKIKEVGGKLVGNERLEEKGKAEKIAADKKVLYEDLKEDVRKLAWRLQPGGQCDRTTAESAPAARSARRGRTACVAPFSLRSAT